MKSSKVLYSTLAASVLLTAGFATVAHADDAVPASSTPETTAVTPAASSSAPAATTPASETPASTTPSTPASSSATPASESVSTPSSASSTSASTPAASAETSASSAAAPKADDKFVEVPVAISLNNFEGSNRIRVTAAADITIPGNVYLEAKMTDVTSNQVTKKSGARLIQLSQTEPVTFGDLYIDSDYEEGHTYKIELSQSQDYVVDGKVYEFASTKDNAPTFTIKNGKVVLTNGPKLPIPTNSAKVKEIPVDVKVQTGKNGLSVCPTVSWKTPVPGRARMDAVLVNVKTGDIVANASGSITGADLSPTRQSDESEVYVGSSAKEGEVYRLYYSSMTDVIEEVNGVNYIYTGLSNPFTIKNGRVELVTETQPTTPSSQPTTPSSHPTTPSSHPTTPSSQPTTPSSKSENTGETSSSSTETSSKKSEKGVKPSSSSSSQSTSDKKDGNTSEVKSGSSQSATKNPETNAATKTNKKASLPNTGEKTSVFATVAGVLVAGLAAFAFKRKKN